MGSRFDAKTILGEGPQRDPFQDAVASLSGQTIHDYHLDRLLGRGAMGVVFLAKQVSLGRTVAVKILHPRFGKDPVFLERFQREAHSAARLSHPHIVQVFDYGVDKGYSFIASEYVDGGTVAARIERKGVVEPTEATGMILQACEGLVAAHKQGIVHRDIKPDNLMLTNRNRSVKITDFGLAKMVETSPDAEATSSGMIVGTPYYMSPEQARGHDLDHRSDIYSLGITYYHMVTGQVPFDAESIIGIMLKHISAERPDPLAINPSLPGAVGEVIRHMIAQRPEDRYQTAAEAIPDLRHLRDQLRQGVTSIFLRRPAVSSERATRYKVLRPEQILFLRAREVQPPVLKNLRALVKGDSGVFLPCAESYPEDTVLEVHFTIPGNDASYRAVGLVRWGTDDARCPGVGVTFVKVGRQTGGASAILPPPEGQAPSLLQTPRFHMMTPEQAMSRLTQTPLHARMLRYYYANANQFVRIRTIAGALGIGMRLLDPVLKTYEECGLLQRTSDDDVNFIWPDDPAMEEQLVNWISEFGLRG